LKPEDKRHPTITAVIPTYNNADTIVEALASIVAQTVPVSEIVIVDDASTDNTVEVVDSFFKSSQLSKLTTFQIIRLPQNGGPAVARNAGIKAAKGDWIAFLDGDDKWFLYRIELQLQALKDDSDLGLLCGRASSFTTSNDAEDSPDFRLSDLRPSTSPLSPQSFVFHNPVPTSTVLVKKKILEQIGGFDESFRGPEDYDLWIRISDVARMVMIEHPLSWHRKTVGSLSMDDRKFLPEVMRVLSKAFGPDGTLHPYGSMKHAAYRTQLKHASDMAFHEGARLRAVKHLLHSQCHFIMKPHKSGSEMLDDSFVKRLLWYTFGSP
jgi:glycosyltransferase involved in cell wall biosynthesis